ncbi:MAG: diguanylate cyclase [Longicatena sp.]
MEIKKREIIKQRNSITYKWTIIILLIIFMQSLLLSGILLCGGVISQTKEEAFQAYSEKTNNKKNYMEGIMQNQWSNIDFYNEKLSQTLEILGDDDVSSKEQMNSFLEKASPIVIAMLRASAATDSFIILNDNNQEDDTHSAIYFRDYGPLLDNKANSDLRLLLGPSNIATKNQTMLGDAWSYGLALDKENQDFYQKPYENAHLSENAKLLEYWSKPFHLNENAEEIITYSRPLFDKNGKLRGVVGTGITMEYLMSFLSGKEVSEEHLLGYSLGYQTNNNQKIQTLNENITLQNRKIDTKKHFSLAENQDNKGVGLLENQAIDNDVYACTKKISLYKNNTPFQKEEWYVVGFMDKEDLLALPNTIQNLLVLSLLISIPLGAICGIFVSRRFTKPITSLVKSVRESDISQEPSYQKTGFLEIDELSGAIEAANKQFIESTLRASQIIDLVGAPIGIFEVREDSEKVFATERLWDVLSLPKERIISLCQNKVAFNEMLKQKMNVLEEDEDHIYRLDLLPPKWIEISTRSTTSSVLGIARDVTAEIVERKKIKLERDYDALTSLCAHELFVKKVNEILNKDNDNRKVSAMLMLDLDDFKKVNDTYGHQWGDIYLRKAGEFMLQMHVDNSIVGRRSGDEFHVFLYDEDSQEEIHRLLHKFYTMLASEPLTCPDGSIKPISISIGLAWVEDGMNDCEELLVNADKALYEAKNNNKGSFRIGS